MEGMSRWRTTLNGIQERVSLLASFYLSRSLGGTYGAKSEE